MSHIVQAAADARALKSGDGVGEKGAWNEEGERYRDVRETDFQFIKVPWINSPRAKPMALLMVTPILQLNV